MGSCPKKCEIFIRLEINSSKGQGLAISSFRDCNNGIQNDADISPVDLVITERTNSYHLILIQQDSPELNSTLLLVII